MYKNTLLYIFLWGEVMKNQNNLISKCIKNIFVYVVVYIKNNKKFIINIKNKLILKYLLYF